METNPIANLAEIRTDVANIMKIAGSAGVRRSLKSVHDKLDAVIAKLRSQPSTR